jgi:hypothetical protein
MSSGVADVDSTIPITETIDNEMPSAILLPLPNTSPFLLKLQDVESLTQSEGFSILRQHLAQYYTYE